MLGPAAIAPREVSFFGAGGGGSFGHGLQGLDCTSGFSGAQGEDATTGSAADSGVIGGWATRGAAVVAAGPATPFETASDADETADETAEDALEELLATTGVPETTGDPLALRTGVPSAYTTGVPSAPLMTGDPSGFTIGVPSALMTGVPSALLAERLSAGHTDTTVVVTATTESLSYSEDKDWRWPSRRWSAERNNGS